MEENFNAMENMEIEGETSAPKRSRKNYIIFGILGIIVIAAIVIILYLVLRDKDDDKDDKQEDTCLIGEEDKCLSCNKDKCASCNNKYKLVNGTCIAEFSFRAIYEINEVNTNISLMNDEYKDNIISMEIDNETICGCTNILFHHQEIILFMLF